MKSLHALAPGKSDVTVCGRARYGGSHKHYGNRTRSLRCVGINRFCRMMLGREDPDGELCQRCESGIEIIDD